MCVCLCQDFGFEGVQSLLLLLGGGWGGVREFRAQGLAGAGPRPRSQFPLGG